MSPPAKSVWKSGSNRGVTAWTTSGTPCESPEVWGSRKVTVTSEVVKVLGSIPRSKVTTNPLTVGVPSAAAWLLKVIGEPALPPLPSAVTVCEPITPMVLATTRGPDVKSKGAT